MKDKQIIEISSKHKVLRTVLFAAAFLIAVGAVFFGLTSYSKKVPGWQEATASPDRDLPDFSRNFRTFVYMEGSSSEIRMQLSAFNKIYTDNLKRIYKLLDAVNSYEGLNNMAYLNSHLGSKVKVPTDLYAVLKDAYAKTETGEYNLFAGPLYRAEEVLKNVESYDGEWEETRIRLLKKELEDSSNYSVDFFDDYTVRINVSDSYIKFLSDYEFDTPILDFGEYYCIYETTMMDSALSDNGYPHCMFYTE